MVVADAPLQIEDFSIAEEVEDSAGIIESIRTVTIKLPTALEPGVKAGSITFRWSDGSTQTQSIGWTVEPKIRALPTTLILNSATTTTDLRVRSAGVPFRIQDVRGPLVVDQGPITDQAATVHSLRLTLDSKRAVAGIKPEIDILTDDPDQPHVRLGVLIVPPVVEPIP